MRRTRSSSSHMGQGILVRSFVVPSALVSLALLAPVVEARIGIPKKVKDAVGKSAEQKATPQAPEEPVVFDEVILELNDERIGNVLAACARVAKVSAARPPLVERSDKVGVDRQKLLDKHEEKIREERNKRSEVDMCRSEGYNAARDRKMQEYSQRALSDPALLERYKNVALQYNAAAASGDTVAIQKAQEAMHAEILPSKEDSAKVVQQCGPMPPLSAEEKRLDALDKELASLHEQIRAVDEKIAAEQASSKTGFNREQWGMAVERIQMYLSAKRSKPKDAPRGFTDEEIVAMEKRLEELKSAACW
ncbi:MAG TPA: hypothetical protein VFP58_04930 [Candidatus Eisenbacteria bacterium]|nr:hypothetical protein [Candidatus Eisenbacteria bacterium]